MSAGLMKNGAEIREGCELRQLRVSEHATRCPYTFSIENIGTCGIYMGFRTRVH